MPAIAFNHFNLRVPRAQLEPLRDFYRDIVGLQDGRRPAFNSFGFWMYLGDQPVLHLSEALPGENRAIGTANAFDHAAFKCIDRPAMEALLKREGITYEVAHVPATRQVQLFIVDPAGNGVELNFDEA